MRKSIIILFFLFTGSLLILNGQTENNEVKQFFYPDGQLSSEGPMKNGKPDGYWKTYYPTGVLKSQGLRTNFLLDSTWSFYNQSGNLVKKINYKFGKKNGYTYTYAYDNSIDGYLVSRELFVNDKKEGLSVYYYPSGKIKSEVYFRNNMKDGDGREYDREGTLISLLEYRNDFLVNRERVNRTDKQGFKQGSWKSFYEDGRLKSEAYYTNNKINGLYKEYDQKGNLELILRYTDGKIVEKDEEQLIEEEIDIRRDFDDQGNMIFQGSFKDDVAIGIHRFYNAQGEVINSMIFNDKGVKISEGIIDEKGNRQGKWMNFYTNGNIKSTGNYVDNERNGKWTFYYENGSTEQEGIYRNGLPDGIWTWYYESDNILKEENYFNGRADGESIEYDEMGFVIAKGNYLNGEKEGEWIFQIGDHKEKGIYEIGLKKGIWKAWFNNDILKFEGEYVQGMENGRHKYYYPNGTLREERFYEMGVKERNWKKYDEAGNLNMTITYKADKEIRINGQKINLPDDGVKVLK